MGDELLGILGIVLEQGGLRREEFPGKRRRITCGIEARRKADVVLGALGLPQEERVVRWKHLETRRQRWHDDLVGARRMRQRHGECDGESAGTRDRQNATRGVMLRCDAVPQCSSPLARYARVRVVCVRE